MRSTDEEIRVSELREISEEELLILREIVAALKAQNNAMDSIRLGRPRALALLQLTTAIGKLNDAARILARSGGEA